MESDEGGGGSVGGGEWIERNVQGRLSGAEAVDLLRSWELAPKISSTRCRLFPCALHYFPHMLFFRVRWSVAACLPRQKLTGFTAPVGDSLSDDVM